MAVHFESNDILPLSASRAEVGASYSCATLCWAILTYGVEKENGRWIVKSEALHIIAKKLDLHRHPPLAPGFPPFEIVR